MHAQDHEDLRRHGHVIPNIYKIDIKQPLKNKIRNHTMMEPKDQLSLMSSLRRAVGLHWRLAPSEAAPEPTGYIISVSSAWLILRGKYSSFQKFLQTRRQIIEEVTRPEKN